MLRTWLLVPLLLLATAFRLSGPAWDGGIGAHPDERYLVGVAEGLRWPDRLDPFVLAPDFPYGHLPLYLVALLGGGDRLLAARLLGGLFDVGTVALAAALGRRVGGRKAGVLAAVFLTVMPFLVQQAHFATADPFLAFFTTGALLFAARLADGGRRRDGVLAGLWAGWAVGCKAGGLLLALPLLAACAAGPGPTRVRAGQGAVVAGAAMAGFALTNPFALLDFPRFFAGVAAQTAMARGAAGVPYTLQYHGTLPYLYPILQQLVWGMGPVLGGLCFGGLGAALWQAARRPPTPAAWVGLSWALPFFAFTGGLYVKFPRYLLPLTPLLAAYGARLLLACPGRLLKGVLAMLAVLPAGLLSLALVLSYRQPHPWVAASAWLREHLPPGSVIAVEAWDHPLPLDSTGYVLEELPLFDEETEAKWDRIEGVLAEADVVVVASRRGYGALAGWPERFPETADYYRDLFAGRRGFAVVACFGRWPRIAGLALADDPFAAVGLPAPDLVCRPSPPVLPLPRLDESFVVYDHPVVIVLRKVADLGLSCYNFPHAVFCFRSPPYLCPCGQCP